MLAQIKATTLIVKERCGFGLLLTGTERFRTRSESERLVPNAASSSLRAEPMLPIVLADLLE